MLSSATRGIRLSTRLGITHGALVAVLIVLLIVTLQGLLRMTSVMSMVSEQKLSTLDAEEELHRSAWAIEVALRHSRVACDEENARRRITSARESFTTVFARRGDAAPPPMRDAALRYGSLADDALSPASISTCAFLASPTTEARRTKLDEEMTDVWIDRLHELHADIEAKEERARAIGTRTTTSGFIIAIVAAVAAVMIARWTARSVTRPIAHLADAATRLGDGDFAPIAPVGGPKEVEDLRRDLERTREKLLGVDRLKKSFLASVSHELRSPLGRLREAIALLSDGTVGELTSQQQRVVTLAKRACEQEVRIVEALLDMSRVSSGLPVQREAGCDIERVVDAAVESEKQVAIERGVSIRVEHSAKRLESFLLDSALVERAVANLVRNAVSVSARSGEVRVRVDEHRTEEHQERVMRIDVSDDGPGLAEGIADRVFEPFLSAAVADRPAGIGLGLSFAREVARAHGGELYVVHDALKTKTTGTTFRFEIPIPRPRAKPAPPATTTTLLMEETSS